MFSNLFRFLPVPFSSFRFYEILICIFVIFFFPRFFLTKYFWIAVFFSMTFYFGYFSIWQGIRSEEMTVSYEFDFVSKNFEFFFIAAIGTFLTSKINSDSNFYAPFRLLLPILLLISILFYILFAEELNLARGNFAMLDEDVGRNAEIFGYGFIYALGFISPVLAYLFHGFKDNKSAKLIFIAITILYFYCIIQSGFATPFISAVAFYIIAFISKGKFFQYKKTIILTAIFLVFFPTELFAVFFYEISDSIPNEYIATKINDLGDLFSGNEFTISGGDGYVAKYRFSKIEPLVESFFSNPFIGGGISTGHHFWLDTISLYGLLGISIWFITLKVLISGVASNVSTEFKPYLQLCFLSLILQSVVKGGTVGLQSFLVLFFFAPLIPYFFNVENKNLLNKND